MVFVEFITNTYLKSLTIDLRSKYKEQLEKTNLAPARVHSPNRTAEPADTDTQRSCPTARPRSRKRLYLNKDTGMAISNDATIPPVKKPRKQPADQNLVSLAVRQMLTRVFGNEFIMSHSCKDRKGDHKYEGLTEKESIQANAIKGTFLCLIFFQYNASFA
jgi:hypothetical protein